MNKKASVLMLGLWILVILAMLVVSAGHRVSLALRLNVYQRDRLRANCLARAAISRAIIEIENDGKQNNYDYLGEKWADSDIFKKIYFDDHENEFATISYLVNVYDRGEVRFGCTDEERKLNINSLDKIQLEELLIIAGFELEAKSLADFIFKWINGSRESEEENKFFKKEKLRALEELLIILEDFYQKNGEENFPVKAQEVYNKIQDLVTVSTLRQVNINSVSSEALTVLMKALLITMPIDSVNPSDVTNLISRIIRFREAGGIFDKNDVGDIKIKLNAVGAELTTAEENIMNNLLANNCITVKSNKFSIYATGSVGRLSSEIRAIYDRNNKQIIAWHEN